MDLMRNNYYFVTFDKELMHSILLADKIIDSEWVEPDMQIINCFPEYSSRVVQFINHKLSHLNNNELFECTELKMPYSNMNQVWDNIDKSYRSYVPYLSDWIRHNIQVGQKYLFLGLDGSGTKFSKLKTMLRGKLDMEDYRFASLYTKDENIFTPDFYVCQYRHDHKLLFEWENIDNSNLK